MHSRAAAAGISTTSLEENGGSSGTGALLHAQVVLPSSTTKGDCDFTHIQIRGAQERRRHPLAPIDGAGRRERRKGGERWRGMGCLLGQKSQIAPLKGLLDLTLLVPHKSLMFGKLGTRRD
jgi:hypothetical protein